MRGDEVLRAVSASSKLTHTLTFTETGVVSFKINSLADLELPGKLRIAGRENF